MTILRWKKHTLTTAVALLALTAPMLLSACGSGLLEALEEGTEDETPAEEQPEEEQPDEETVAGDICSENMQGADPVLGELIPTPEHSPKTVFRQTVTATQADDSDFENPFQINYWDVESDLSVSDGSDDQLDTVMQLTIGTPDGSGGVTTSSQFFDNNYSDLSFYGPTLGSCNGVMVSRVVENSVFDDLGAGGSYHLIVGTIAHGTTQQTLTVPMSADTLSWHAYNDTSTGYFSGEPDNTLKVVLRDASGTSLAEADLNSQSLSVTSLVGQEVVLSIESEANGYAYGYIDDLVFKDSGLTAIAGSVPNGDFESGDLTGWTTNEPSEIQNLTSNTQTLEGVEVTRSFFTIPNKVWGRWTDTIHNPGATDITVRVMYDSEMGSDDDGFMFPIGDSGVQGLSEFDGSGDRDAGFVFGNGATVSYSSATATSATTYNSADTDEVDHYYDITIPAGGTKTIVNFAILNGQTTAYYGTFDLQTARPVEIEETINDILENFWTDGQYRTGMTQEQIDSIANF